MSSQGCCCCSLPAAAPRVTLPRPPPKSSAPSDFRCSDQRRSNRPVWTERAVARDERIAAALGARAVQPAQLGGNPHRRLRHLLLAPALGTHPPLSSTARRESDRAAESVVCRGCRVRRVRCSVRSFGSAPRTCSGAARGVAWPRPTTCFRHPSSPQHFATPRTASRGRWSSWRR